jgi:soluble lytic murein transglycosylase-like protein
VAVPKPLEGDCSLVNGYDWDVSIAYAICMAESGGNPKAYNVNSNGSNDKGLMQINSIHVNSGLISDEGRYDPQQNIASAYAIYKGSGFRAWSAYLNNSYLKYL